MAQSRIALAGYDACHELAACMLSATLAGKSSAHILVVGVGGGGQEIVAASMLAPEWRFTAVDPSPPMMDIAIAQLTQKGLATQTDFRPGYVDDLPLDSRFDAATLIGVLHHQPGDKAKRQLLKSIASRLSSGRSADPGGKPLRLCQSAAVLGRMGRALAHAGRNS